MLLKTSLCLAIAAAAWAQPAAPPTGEASSPADCLARIDKLNRASSGQKGAIAAGCLERFPLSAAHGTDLLDLAVLHAEADQHERAKAAIEKRLAEPGLTDAQRGDALDALITASQRGSRSDEIRPRSILVTEEVAPRLEQLGDGATWQKLVAYRWLTSYYRGDPDDHGKVFHAASRFMELYAKLPAEQQHDSLAVFGLYCAYEDLAGVYSSRGDTERAKALLREGIPKVTTASLSKGLQKALLHYEMVGNPAPAIEAPYWINAQPEGNRIGFAGKVTVLEFTAHWCLPCKESYPALERLERRFAGRGLQVLLATSLYGYFGKDHGLSLEAEMAADRKYFIEENKLKFPVAIAAKSAEDKNAQNYGVQAIPEIVVVDRKGTVRRFLTGLGPSEEQALIGMLEEMLKP